MSTKTIGRLVFTLLFFAAVNVVAAPPVPPVAPAPNACAINSAAEKKLADNAGPYLASICLGDPPVAEGDSPASQTTHSKKDVQKSVCPPGVVAAACFQRRGETLAYSCMSGLTPSVASGAVQKTPNGCEGPQLSLDPVTGITNEKPRPYNCRSWSEQAWKISCPPAPAPAPVAESAPPAMATPVPSPVPVPAPADPASARSPAAPAPTPVSPGSPPDAGTASPDSTRDPLSGINL